MLPDLLTLVSAVLLVVSFPPWNFAPLIWIALIPFFFALAKTRSHREAAIQGLWLSIGMSLGGFHWVSYVLVQYGNLPQFAGWLGLAAFSLIGQPQFTLLAPVQRRWLHDFNTQGALGISTLMALLYAGIDWALPKLWVDTLGHSLYQAMWLRQIADLGGPPLLTFLIVFVNQAIYQLIERIRRRGEPSLGPALRAASPQLAASALLLGLALGYGAWRSSSIEDATLNAPRSVQIAAIQANIGDFDKIASERGLKGAADKVVSTFISMSDQALELTPKPELLIWPETAYPSTFRTPMNADEFSRDQTIEAFVSSRGVPLLFGGYDHKRGLDYNTLFMLSPPAQGSPKGFLADDHLQIYHKNKLLFFGEYLPGTEWLPFLKSAFPQVANFGRGPGPSVFPFELQQRSPTRGRATGTADSRNGRLSLKIAPIICYEALFTSYTREGIRKGGDLLLNITNDSWFGPIAEPDLHLSLTVFRSIETRVAQFRSTNTGISSLILPSGEITQATPIGAQTILNARVPLLDPQWTLIMWLGDWFAPVALAIGGMGLWRRRRKTAS